MVYNGIVVVSYYTASGAYPVGRCTDNKRQATGNIDNLMRYTVRIAENVRDDS